MKLIKHSTEFADRLHVSNHWLLAQAFSHTYFILWYDICFVLRSFWSVLCYKERVNRMYVSKHWLLIQPLDTDSSLGLYTCSESWCAIGFVLWSFRSVVHDKKDINQWTWKRTFSVSDVWCTQTCQRLHEFIVSHWTIYYILVYLLNSNCVFKLLLTSIAFCPQWLTVNVMSGLQYHA